MNNFLLRSFLICLLATSVTAQQPADRAKPAPSKERRGAIKGRVVTDSGQALANISIGLYSTGTERRMQSTDEDGRFEIDDLAPAVFTILPIAPGYVLAGNPNERRFCRIGDEVTLTMIKGGVITGMVRNAAGEPVVGVQVSVVRVRDAEGKPSMRAVSRDRMTDDRGIYRFYGLEPGAYLIAAGGRSNFYIGGLNKYADDVKTYHPSSTLETAAEVMVQNAQEVSGIDINYRGGKGHTISGKVANAGLPPDDTPIVVSLIQAVSGIHESSAVIRGGDGNSGFALSGIADGEYLIRAELSSGKNVFSSQARRVLVKGSDIAGIELALAPMAAISGVVVLEAATGAGSRAQCEKQRLATLEEMVLTFRKDMKNESPDQRWWGAGTASPPDEKGEFRANRLAAGIYRLSANLPSETWYIKSQSLSASSRSNQPNYRTQQLNEVANRGITVRAGEQLATLTVTIAEGAAGLSGVVKAASEREALPPRLRVYLIPGERENANDVLRFFQAEVQFDGAFSFNNLPPGRYRALTRAASDEGVSALSARPLFWDSEGRALLVKEAAGENALLELSPCRRITDYVLRHGMARAAVAPTLKK